MSATNDITIPSPPSRRRFLAGGAIAVGGTVALGWPQMAFGATKVKEIARAAAALELTAVEAYAAAAASGKITTKAIADAAAAFAAHHLDHATTLLGISGVSREQVGPDKSALDGAAKQLSVARTEADVLKIALSLENAAVTTYIVALGTQGDGDFVRAMASILPVEASHAVVLGQAIGAPLGDVGFLPALESIPGG